MFDILDTDGYKFSHYLQDPEGITNKSFYIEARSGTGVLFFGLQAILKKLGTVTKDNIEEARALCESYGTPFNYEGWLYILREHGGNLPIRIRAIPEGTFVAPHIPLIEIRATDDKCTWLPSFIETQLMRIWYPTTVATTSFKIRAKLQKFIDMTAGKDYTDQFFLHDFGARGVSSSESAALGGLAHLVSFQGTDTVVALRAANQLYDEPIAGFSVPAAEHSTITSWGKDREVDAYRNMIERFGKPGSIMSVVSDSYDVYKAVEQHWGTTLRQEVIDSGATLVIRPDSGDPVSVVLKVFELVDKTFGSTLNEKGYKVLNHVRVLQGDGINSVSAIKIVEAIVEAGFSVENLVLGMGGGLLQNCTRDTHAFAMKCSAVQETIGGFSKWRGVSKNPVTDSGKKSKNGQVVTLQHRDFGTFKPATYLTHDEYCRLAGGPDWRDAMRTVYVNGKLFNVENLQTIRDRASTYLGHVS